MKEFLIFDKGVNLFKASSGCQLHTDTTCKKCKFLALGRWIGTLSQEDIALYFLKLSDHLDMLGVKLSAKYTTFRKRNGEAMVSTIKNIMDKWKTGKFLTITSRPWSSNIYTLSKIWFWT